MKYTRGKVIDEQRLLQRFPAQRKQAVSQYLQPGFRLKECGAGAAIEFVITFMISSFLFPFFVARVGKVKKKREGILWLFSLLYTLHSSYFSAV